MVGSVGARYVHSRLTTYRAVLVDTRWCRAIHSCDSCPYRAENAPPGALQCRAVHYGMCTAVRLTRKGRGQGNARQLHIITQV